MAGAMILDDIAAALRGTGLVPRGGFHPVPGEGGPSMPDGGDAGTVVLVGNMGPALWKAFIDTDPDLEGRNPLDDWLDPILEDAAAAVGAHVVFPNKGPVFPPVQRWARRAEPVHPSPIGLLIHPTYGLWHVYRAAFCFEGHLELPARADQPNPCDDCAKKPCLRVCPADAFQPDGFDALGCVAHVTGPTGGNCASRGCLARRACPVGRDFAYPKETGAFHMRGVVRAVRSGYGVSGPRNESQAPE